MGESGIAGLLLLCVPLLAQHGSTTAVNPYTGPEHAKAGAALYRAQCAGCHGLDGKGAGAGPSLTSGTFQRGGSDEALFQSISKGVPGTAMPGFSAFTGLQIWQLITHLRALEIVHGESQVKGDPKAGAAVFRANCQRCHVVRGEGGFIGPEFTSVGARLSPSELQKALIDPDADVAADYWSVKVTTAAGKTLSGTRLNEDTHSLQIRSEQGQLVSLLKRDVAKSEIIRRSPMPAFKGKLSEAQLDDVLAYLTKLRGAQ